MPSICLEIPLISSSWCCSSFVIMTFFLQFVIIIIQFELMNKVVDFHGNDALTGKIARVCNYWCILAACKGDRIA